MNLGKLGGSFEKKVQSGATNLTRRLHSCEHKAISPKSATCTLNFYEVFEFWFAPHWDFFSKDPPIYPNTHTKLTKIKIRSVQTLLRITHLAHRKSYLVIICPNSHEKLTKTEIR